MGLDHRQLVDAVEREAGDLADALAAGPVGARVLTCPDWDVLALARHVGEFTSFWTHVVCEATSRPKTKYEPTPPTEPAALAAWYRELAGGLVGVLRSTDGDQPSWTWVPSQQHVGFVARRCANELAMHRYDAQSARGTCAPVDADLAAECVIEVRALLEGWSLQTDFQHKGTGRSLHLCPTDSSHEIVLTLLPGDLGITFEHAETASLTLRGTSSDLALIVFDRPALGPVERLGDDHVLDEWYEEFHFG